MPVKFLAVFIFVFDEYIYPPSQNIESNKAGMKPQSKQKDLENGQCCMCGDVGFSHHLRRCPACLTRLQHTYCSRMYPGIDMKSWQCEWCLHKDIKIQQLQQLEQEKHSSIKTTKLKKRHSDHLTPGDCHTTVTAKKLYLQQKQQQRRAPSSKSSETACHEGPWRKIRCSSSSSQRVARRRYKLVADMLC